MKDKSKASIESKKAEEAKAEEARAEESKPVEEEIKAEHIKRDILDKKADKKYKADQRRDSWESMRKFLSRIVGAGKRKKD